MNIRQVNYNSDYENEDNKQTVDNSISIDTKIISFPLTKKNVRGEEKLKKKKIFHVMKN